MLVRCLVFIFVLLVVGELIVRLDSKKDPFNNGSVVRVGTKIIASEEILLYEQNKLPITSEYLRILIIGDSYVFGAGVDSSKKLSSRLKQNLLCQNNLSNTYKNIYVMDISRPANNTLDNYINTLPFLQKFRPHVLIWGYTFGDILGGLSPEAEKQPYLDKFKSIKPRYSKQKSKLHRFTNAMYKMFSVIHFSSLQIQNQLMLLGFPLPFGDFHYLTGEAYRHDSMEWIRTQEMILDISKACGDSTYFILYHVPEFNLLRHRKLFKRIEASFNSFMSRNPQIHYMNGWDLFNPDESDSYCLSKHNAHPNGLAHGLWADQIYSEIRIHFPINRMPSY